MGPVDQSGGVAIVGDSGEGSWLDGPILRELARGRGRGRPARVVLIEVGVPLGASRADGVRSALGGLGVGDVRAVGVAGRDDAGRPSIIALVERASAVVLEGPPRRLVALLAETRLDEALRRRALDGLMLAGVGPGAAALGNLMVLDDPVETESLALLDGLGYLVGTVIDSAFAVEDGLERLRPAIAERPEALGIGVEASTALLVRQGVAEVLGEGSVTVLATARAADPAVPGRLIRHILAAGDRFDLGSRVRIPSGSNGLDGTPGSDGSAHPGPFH